MFGPCANEKVLQVEICNAKHKHSHYLLLSNLIAAVETSEAQILYTWITSNDGLILVKEWYDRQSPFVIWGVNAHVGKPDAWDATAGKCECITNTGIATYIGYPFTNETIPFRESYLERWGEFPDNSATYAYDTLRFILPDAISSRILCADTGPIPS